MKIDASMHQRLEQRQLLKLSPQIIQQIEILQLATLELQQLVKQELEQNPALELEAEVPQKASEDETEEKIGPDLAAQTAEESETEAQEDTLRFLEEQQEFVPYRRVRSAAAEDDYDAMNALQNTAEHGATLQNYLHKQATLVETNGRLRPLLDFMIDCLDNNGYLSMPLDSIIAMLNRSTLAVATGHVASRGVAPAEGREPSPQLETASPGQQPLPSPVTQPATSAGSVNSPAHATPADQGAIPVAVAELIYSIADAEAVLHTIQGFEPKGIAARDLKECLLLQLSEADPDYATKYRLIQEHMDDIMHNNLPDVAKKISMPMEQLMRLVDQIKAMNPKPGSNISAVSVPRIVPDVVVDWVEDSYEIRMEKSYLPPLCVSPDYVAILKDKSSSLEAKQFVRSKVDAAKRLIGAIEQRRNTLQRIAVEIVKAQKDFLDKGITYLRPFKMQEVADKINVHVSTVGRAIAEKYMMTPRGIFKMKFFFTGGIDMTDGKRAASRVSVIARIKELFEQEDKSKPLNDDEAAEILKKEGYAIARRTVAKYRQELNVPSARMRKRYY
jgi:RNA polymerase sigma-54 factor